MTKTADGSPIASNVIVPERLRYDELAYTPGRRMTLERSDVILMVDGAFARSIRSAYTRVRSACASAVGAVLL